jgi:hypothetical protein
MFPLIFHIPKLPDLKFQKYVAIFGQGVRQKFLSSQKDLLLLLRDLGRVFCAIDTGYNQLRDRV